ncbi:MAG: NADH-quinone oxidoreductase subunit K [Bacteroidales bacterium]|nr:NADH-quinone oxidoreductase subunit K [Bacteroidales bacterium]
MNLPGIEYLSLGLGIVLFLAGLWGIIHQKNIIKIIISFSVLDTSIHLILVSIGYMRNRTAPIIDSAVSKTDAASQVVDPLPQALVLTAIVIGVGITALMLTYALKLFNEKGTLEIDKFKSLKW